MGGFSAFMDSLDAPVDDISRAADFRRAERQFAAFFLCEARLAGHLMDLSAQGLPFPFSCILVVGGCFRFVASFFGPSWFWHSEPGYCSKYERRSKR